MGRSNPPLQSMGNRIRHPRQRKVLEIPQEEFFGSVDELAPKERVVAHRDETGKTSKYNRFVMIRHKPVAWGIPFDETVFSKWVINLIGLPMMPWDTAITTSGTYLPDARNTVHRIFVEESDVEWLVMLDSDVLPPLDFLSRLLAHKKKMVGGWYRKKGEPYPPVVYDYSHLGDDGIEKYNIRISPGEGLESVDAAGAGCWLMHRNVAEAIGSKPYDMQGGGEDMKLCRKVIDAGFKIWIDWSVACAHCGVAIV